MAKREHWTHKLKRKNKELEARNVKLEAENKGLRLAVDSPSLAAAGEPPNYLFVAVIDSGSNWLCEHQTFRLESSFDIMSRESLADGEVDITVEDKLDKAEGANFSGGAELQGKPDFVLENLDAFLLEHTSGKSIRNIYDSFGFLSEIHATANNVVRERLKLADAEPEKPKETRYGGYWQVGFPNLKQVMLNGESFIDLWSNAGSDYVRAKLMGKLESTIRVAYQNGKQHDKRFNHFALQADEETKKPHTITFSVIADKGQSVTVGFATTTPEERWIDNYMERMPDDTFSNADPEGGTLEFSL